MSRNWSLSNPETTQMNECKHKIHQCTDKCKYTKNHCSVLDYSAQEIELRAQNTVCSLDYSAQEIELRAQNNYKKKQMKILVFSDKLK